MNMDHMLASPQAFYLHATLLLTIFILLIGRRSVWTLDVRLIAFAIVSWSSILLASFIAAAFNQLGNQILFCALSLGIQLFSCWIIWRMQKRETADVIESRELFFQELLNTGAKKFAVLSFLFVAGLCLFMASRTRLQIPDTLSIKLPNAFFALKSGSYLPARQLSDDGRMFSVPFNGTTLWMYLIRFAQSNRWIVVANYFFWILMFFTIYRISRLLQTSRWSAFSAAAFFCMSQTLVFQATSDNDDLLSALPGTVAVLFLLSWLRKKRSTDLLYAAISFGICTGAKLFTALYFPALVLGVTYFTWNTFRQAKFKEKLKYIYTWGISAIVMLLFVLPYIIFRFSAGTNSALLTASENRPFSFLVGLHNLIVYNSQLIVSPIVDAFFPESSGTRTHIVETINSFFISNIVPHVENYFAYIAGVKIVHPQLYDNTGWYGIIAWPMLAALLFIFSKKKFRFSTFFWLGIFFISWDVFFCVRSKYIEELGRYWILPMSLLVPLVAVFFDHLYGNRKRIYQTLIVFVWIVSVFSSVAALRSNSIRYNSQLLLQSPLQSPIFSSEMMRVMNGCPNINFVRTIYGYPIYWNMSSFTGTDFTYLSNPQKDRVNIYPELELPLMAAFYEHKYIAVELPEDVGTYYLGESNSHTRFFADRGGSNACGELFLKSHSQLLFDLVPQQVDFVPPTVPMQVKLFVPPPDFEVIYRIVAQDGAQESILSDWSNENNRTVQLQTSSQILRIDVKVKPKYGDSKESPVYSGQITVPRR